MKRILAGFLFPGNLVSDAAGLSDPGERGAMGMFVNALVWMTAGILLFLLIYFVWLR